jgi:hypothetical protein
MLRRSVHDSPRRYTDQQARAIFERALRVEADGRMGHEELVAAAAEVGLSREAVERAVDELERAQAEREAKAAILGRRRRRLFNHLVPFVAINAFLFLVNWLTTPGTWWCLFPLFGWGLLLFFHAWLALSRRVSSRALRRELARAERRQRRTLAELGRETARLGTAVEGGVAASSIAANGPSPASAWGPSAQTRATRRSPPRLPHRSREKSEPAAISTHSPRSPL